MACGSSGARCATRARAASWSTSTSRWPARRERPRGRSPRRPAATRSSSPRSSRPGAPCRPSGPGTSTSPRCAARAIEADLALRDFTVNAIAVPLAERRARRSTPTAGSPTWRRGVLRAVSERTFADDPLRLLRAARIAAALELELDPATVELARARGAARRRAGRRAPVRRAARAPHRRRSARGHGASGRARCDRRRAARARGAPRRRAEPLPPPRRPRPHDRGPGAAARGRGGPRALRGRARAGEVDGAARRAARRRADPAAARCASPPSSTTSASPRPGREAEGGLRHSSSATTARGAGSSASSAARLRTSRRLADYLEPLTLNHLRLGFLVHERPLSRRAVYEYLRATDPDSVDATLLTVADRLATQGGAHRQEAIDAHLELAREMIGEALEWRRERPPALADPRRRARRRAGHRAGPRARPPDRRDRGRRLRRRGRRPRRRDRACATPEAPAPLR